MWIITVMEFIGCKLFNKTAKFMDLIIIIKKYRNNKHDQSLLSIETRMYKKSVTINY